MSAPALRVAGLGKRYRLGLTHAGSLSEAASRWTRRLRGLPPVEAPVDAAPGATPADKKGDFWALRDVSFEVQTGEVVGVIGRNGAGKSTLLKILSRVTAPTVGEVRVRGRVGSLLEVGTGFHPELTGRENVYMNATLLGMSQREVHAKLDEIVDFAGVEKFLDTPVKRYSSGMKVRLGFAVAAHLEPEVLIVDEVLAVGDHEFQRKCLGKMQTVAGEGRTVLFVSHNMSAVSTLCPRVVVLVGGQVALDDLADKAIARYRAAAEDESMGGPCRRGAIEFLTMSVRTANGDARKEFSSLEPLQIDATFQADGPLRRVQVGCEFLTATGDTLFRTFSDDVQGGGQFSLAAGEMCEVSCTVPGRFLNSGTYGTRLMVVTPDEILTRPGPRVSVAFDVPNPERVVGTRSGAVAPIADWSVSLKPNGESCRGPSDELSPGLLAASKCQ